MLKHRGCGDAGNPVATRADAREDGGAGAGCVQEQAELQARRDAERSAREEAEAQLKLDNEERMRRLAAFQALAADRMQKQQASLGPLMVNLKQSHAELTEAENLQVRWATAAAVHACTPVCGFTHATRSSE